MSYWIQESCDTYSLCIRNFEGKSGFVIHKRVCKVAYDFSMLERNFDLGTCFTLSLTFPLYLW